MFGLGAVLVKSLSASFDSALIAVMALTLSALLLVGSMAFTKASLLQTARKLTRQDWLNLFLYAFPGTSLPLLFIIAGFALSSALEGGLLLQLGGLFGLLFSVLLLGERIQPRQRVGIILLALSGVLVVVAGSGGSGSSILGDLLIVLGSLGSGFSTVPAKRLSGRIDPFPLTALRLILSAVTIIPLAALQFWLTGNGSLLWKPTPGNLAVLLLYSITSFSLAYLLVQIGFSLLKAWHMAAFGQTIPLFSSLFAILLLHDQLSLFQGIGGLVAIAGGMIISLNQQAAPLPAPKVLVAVQAGREEEQAPFPD
jgi:drug/metabolite transporter (DMT)-like permease